MIAALALAVAGFYSGAALYVTLVEKPALLTLEDQAALAGWKIALKRGAVSGGSSVTKKRSRLLKTTAAVGPNIRERTTSPC